MPNSLFFIVLSNVLWCGVVRDCEAVYLTEYTDFFYEPPAPETR